MWFPAKLDNSTRTSRIMGDSEIRGEIATLIPSLFPFFKVSENTKVVRGPGDTPAARPTMIPKRKNSKIIFKQSSDPVARARKSKKMG